MEGASVQEHAPELEAELLAHTLREVRRCYQQLNWSLFGGQLAQPTLAWRPTSQLWGSFEPRERLLSLNPRLLDRGWGMLVEVLKHEMAHQFVAEVAGSSAEEPPHGPTFRRVCAERGIDAAAAGDPAADELSRGPAGSSSASAPQDFAVLRKIEGLLALATSENQHEAEVAMAQARRLMLRYNLNAARTGRYAFRHLGRATGRRMAWQRALANILSEYFFVSIIIVPVYRPREKKRGSVLEACGTPTNLEMAAYVHGFLVQTAEALWRLHKKQRRLHSDKDRQSFLYGVMSGFSDKLAAEARRNQQEGLVWLGDPELHAYFRRRHPHVRQVGGRSQLAGGAFSDGHAAGGRIVLHRGVDGGKASEAPRQLGSGGRS